MTHKLVPLEPCPFCGGTKILEDFVPNTGGNVKFMWCQTCNAHGPWFDRNVLPPPKFQWNRRAVAPSPPAQEEIARLRAELAAARDENARLTTLYAAATESLAAAWDEARKQ